MIFALLYNLLFFVTVVEAGYYCNDCGLLYYLLLCDTIKEDRYCCNECALYYYLVLWVIVVELIFVVMNVLFCVI